MSQSLASAFIDLATFDLLEQRLYSPYGVNYYMKCVRRAKWSSHIPATMRKTNEAEFGRQFSGRFVRSADIVLRQWLRLEISAVEFKDSVKDAIELDGSNTVELGWPINFGHNIIDNSSLSFNDVVAQRIDSIDLDMFKQWKVTASQRDNYNVMIGNVTGIQLGRTVNKLILPELVLNIPLPWFFSRDSGFGLPMCSLPFNNVDVNFEFRKWEDLLAIDGLYTPSQESPICPTKNDLKSDPKIEKCEIWTEYALLEEQERLRMANTPREMIIEQYQTTRKTVEDSTEITQTDVRFSHAVKSLQWVVRNRNKIGKGNQVERWSQYTVEHNSISNLFINPISKCSLLYEGTARLFELNADFFTEVEPYYKAVARDIPNGYHLYSYELHFGGLNPSGSTNYSALNNPSLKVFYKSTATIENLELVVKANSATVVVFMRGGFGFVTY